MKLKCEFEYVEIEARNDLIIIETCSKIFRITGNKSHRNKMENNAIIKTILKRGE